MELGSILTGNTNEKSVEEQGTCRPTVDRTSKSEDEDESADVENNQGLTDQNKEIENDKDDAPTQNETSSNISAQIKKEQDVEPPEMLGSAKEEIDQEEWCAVCHDGGDLLYCCDRCPKIYHLYCYIPPLTEEPPDDWVRKNVKSE